MISLPFTYLGPSIVDIRPYPEKNAAELAALTARVAQLEQLVQHLLAAQAPSGATPPGATYTHEIARVWAYEDFA